MTKSRLKKSWHNAILVFEESHFLLIRMVCHEERIDTAFSSGETAAAGHSGVDLILGNEMLDGWHLGKVRRKSPAGQVKVFQVLPDFPWPMVMKAQQVTILLIGSPEGSVFFLECLAESRVTQLLRQAAGLLPVSPEEKAVSMRSSWQTIRIRRK